MSDPSASFVIEAVSSVLKSCALEGPAGSYRRTPHRDAEADPAACAAATRIQQMLGALPGKEPERSEWIETLQSFQDEETGLFDQGPRGLIHSAMCTAALHCMHATPAYAPATYMAHQDPESMRTFLRERDWCKQPENSGYETGALYVLLHRTEGIPHDWAPLMAQWFAEEVDEHTGLIRKACISPVELEGTWSLLPCLCAALQPIAICEHARQPLAMPWRLVDTALEVMEFHQNLFFKRRGHRHLPWVFALSHGMRATTHRHEEARQALMRFLPEYLEYLKAQIRKGAYDRILQAQWDLATLAELQASLPGVLTGIPALRQPLDEAPIL